jgi:hypothetical protein
MGGLVIATVPQRATTPRKSKNWGYFAGLWAQVANSPIGALWGGNPEKRLISRLLSTARHFEVWRAVVRRVRNAPPRAAAATDVLKKLLVLADVSRYLDLKESTRQKVAVARAEIEAILHRREIGTPAKLAQLIGSLNDASFTKREAATKELLELAEVAEPALRETLKAPPSLEVRRRVEHVLATLAHKRDFKSLEPLPKD